MSGHVRGRTLKATFRPGSSTPSGLKQGRRDSLSE
jgi:hypothetical protein